jgi:hypothetical protein
MWQQAVHPGQYCLRLQLPMRALERLALNSKLKGVNESGTGAVRLHA